MAYETKKYNSSEDLTFGEVVFLQDLALLASYDAENVALASDLTDHINDTSNPHEVTLEQARTQGNQLSGDIDFNTNKAINLASPTSGNDAATKDYVDNIKEGLKWKQSVKAATTADITLSGEQIIDDISLVAGDRVLVKDQTDETENGFYVVASGAWSRSADADSGLEIVASAVNVEQGTTNADVMFVNTNDDITLGVTDITFITLGSTISHNNTTGKQGGTTGEYYHLTQAQHSALHVAVTLAGENYLSLSGQQITANAVNLATSNVTGNLPVANLNGGTNASSLRFWRGDGNWSAGFSGASPSFFLSASSGAAIVNMAATSGQLASIQMREQSGNNIRWDIVKDSTAESGSDVGSNFQIRRYNDGGTYQDTPIFIQRSSGLVGINQTSPTTRLHINSVAGNTFEPILSLQNAHTSTQTQSVGLRFAVREGTLFKGGIAYRSTDTFGRGAIAFLQESTAAGTQVGIANEVMTILNGGNVGIGTTAPAVKLTVKQSSSLTDPAGMAASVVGLFQGTGNAQLTIANSGAGSLSVLSFGNESDYNPGAIEYNTSDHSMSFRTNDTSNRLIINSSGQVGIGTSPSTLFHLGSAGTAQMRMTGANGNTLFQSSQEFDIVHTRTSGEAILDFQGISSDGTSGTRYRFGLTTGSTGQNQINLFQPNGSTLQTVLGTSGMNSYINAQGGNLGIRTTTPLSMLSIGTPGNRTNNATHFIAGDADLGTTAGNMTYVGEFRYKSGNDIRLQFLGRRVSAGSTWETTSWRIQPAVDSSFTGESSNRGYIEFYPNSAGRLGLSGSGGANPDFYLSSGGLFSNVTDPATQLELSVDSLLSTRGMSISQFGNNIGANTLVFRKARGTRASPATVTNGDYLGAMNVVAHDGTAFRTISGFYARANDTIGTNSIPNEFGLYASAAATSDPVTNNAVVLKVLSTGIAQVKQGLAAAGTFANLGGTINSDHTSANTGNEFTTQSETTLRSFSIPASTLGTNGDVLEFEVTAYLEASDIDDEATLRIKFGSQTIFTQTVTGSGFSSTQRVAIRGTIMRTSATTQEINVSGGVFGAANYTAGTQTLANALNFVVTGQTVVDTTSAKVTYNTSWIRWQPAK